MGTRRQKTSVFEVTKVVTVKHDSDAPEAFIHGLASETPFKRVGAHIDHGSYCTETHPAPIRVKRIRPVYP
jgi:hypothetical protein